MMRLRDDRYLPRQKTGDHVTRNNIQTRKGTMADWRSSNPVLEAGEPGFETDTKKLKFGDGAIAWNDLPYFSVDGGEIYDGDPYFDQVVLLLHMDGNGSSFTDSSSHGWAVVTSGGQCSITSTRGRTAEPLEPDELLLDDGNEQSTHASIQGPPTHFCLFGSKSDSFMQ
jgi:hypothetical protein